MLDKQYEHEKYNDREKLKSLLQYLGISVAVIIIISVYFGITSSKNEKAATGSSTHKPEKKG